MSYSHKRYSTLRNRRFGLRSRHDSVTGHKHRDESRRGKHECLRYSPARAPLDPGVTSNRCFFSL